MGKPTQLPTNSNFRNEQSIINQQLESQKNNVQNLYGYSSAGLPTKGLTPLEDKNKLSKLGGLMYGPLAFSNNTVTISSGDLDISTNSVTDTPAKSFVIMATETGFTDTIDTISGRKYAGQLLVITSAIPGSTITLTNAFGADGQIRCPNATDLDIAYPNSAILIDDNNADGVYQTWRVIGTAEGGGGSWVGTATSNLDMGGYDIINIDDIKMAVGDKYFFDGGTDTYMTGSSTSGRINVFNNTVNVTSFLTSGILTTGITCSTINTTGNVDINGNSLVLDGDGDTKISSSSDDNIQFSVGGSVRAGISNAGLLMSSNISFVGADITMQGNDIDMAANGNIILDNDNDTVIVSPIDDNINFSTGGSVRMNLTNTGLSMSSDINIGGYDLDFSTGGTVDFHDIDSGPHSSGGASALPANPTSYFVVKYQGATRYIPYYS
jgi:hypothetical protein